MDDDTLLPLLAVFGLGSAVFFLCWIVVTSGAAKRRAQLQRRLAPAEEDTVAIDSPAAPPRTLAGRFNAAFADLVSRTGLNIDPQLALALTIFSGVAPAAVVFIWQMDDQPWLALPTFVAGLGAPLFFFVWRQGAWRRTVRGQLPDAFYLLSRSLRAGRSMDQAFQLVGTESAAPLSKEFLRMTQQLELGLPLAPVVQATARRLSLADFTVFAALVALHRTTGGNLAVLLDRLASATRDHNQFEGAYRAATVLGRYSASFIAAISVLVLVYLFGFQRDWAQRFFDSGIGVALFSTALGLEAAGLGLLWLFLRDEY